MYFYKSLPEKYMFEGVNTFDFPQNKCGRIRRQVLEERGKYIL